MELGRWVEKWSAGGDDRDGRRGRLQRRSGRRRRRHSHRAGAPPPATHARPLPARHGGREVPARVTRRAQSLSPPPPATTPSGAPPTDPAAATTSDRPLGAAVCAAKGSRGEGGKGDGDKGEGAGRRGTGRGPPPPPPRPGDDADVGRGRGGAPVLARPSWHNTLVGPATPRGGKGALGGRGRWGPRGRGQASGRAPHATRLAQREGAPPPPSSPRQRARPPSFLTGWPAHRGGRGPAIKYHQLHTHNSISPACVHCVFSLLPVAKKKKKSNATQKGRCPNGVVADGLPPSFCL